MPDLAPDFFDMMMLRFTMSSVGPFSSLLLLLISISSKAKGTSFEPRIPMYSPPMISTFKGGTSWYPLQSSSVISKSSEPDPATTSLLRTSSLSADKLGLLLPKSTPQNEYIKTRTYKVKRTYESRYAFTWGQCKTEASEVKGKR